MAAETHARPAAPAARRRTRPAPETQPDNPPIRRADGTFRPLDQDLVDRLIESSEESYRKNPDLVDGLIAIADESHGKVPLGDGS